MLFTFIVICLAAQTVGQIRSARALVDCGKEQKKRREEELDCLNIECVRVVDG